MHGDYVKLLHQERRVLHNEDAAKAQATGCLSSAPATSRITDSPHAKLKDENG